MNKFYRVTVDGLSKEYENDFLSDAAEHYVKARENGDDVVWESFEIVHNESNGKFYQITSRMEELAEFSPEKSMIRHFYNTIH